MEFTIAGIDTTCRVIVHPSSGDQNLYERLTANWSWALTDLPGQATVETQLSERSVGDAVTAPDPDQLSVQLTQAITRKLISQQAGRLLMLHAAALSNTAGDAIAFVASGGTGKTTIARTLGDRYGYVTDETVAIRKDMSIAPYLKPLSLRDGGTWKNEVSPGELGLTRPGENVRLRKIVLLVRDNDATAPERTNVPLFDAIEVLVSQASSLNLMDSPLQFIAQIADNTGGIERWTYSEADSLLPFIADILGEQ